MGVCRFSFEFSKPLWHNASCFFQREMLDVAIVGAGAAGFAAGIYSARSKLVVGIFGSEIGGTTAKAFEIENYPGFEKILGRDLAEKMRQHAFGLGVQIFQDTVQNVEKVGSEFHLRTVQGNFKARAIVLATGTRHRHLGAKGEQEFAGKGVSFCATCDGFFFKDKKVAVIGGGDSAATAAIFLGEVCREVFVIFRKNEMRAEPFWVDKILQNKKIKLLPQTNVLEFCGGAKLESLQLDSGKALPVDGAFVQIGADPENALAKELQVETDRRGFLKVDHAQQTSVDGVFAAGDCTNGSDNFEQVATAISEGAIAARNIFLWLKKSS